MGGCKIRLGSQTIPYKSISNAANELCGISLSKDAGTGVYTNVTKKRGEAHQLRRGQRHSSMTMRRGESNERLPARQECCAYDARRG